MSEPCPHCSDTGDVHRADGEWLGLCSCGAIPQGERAHLELIVRCNPDLLLHHIREDTAFDALLLERVFDLAKERAAEILAMEPK